eukprot:450170-Alexandrium_andersonii.AAC.1
MRTHTLARTRTRSHKHTNRQPHARTQSAALNHAISRDARCRTAIGPTCICYQHVVAQWLET